jgi:hypothetical protein
MHAFVAIRYSQARNEEGAPRAQQRLLDEVLGVLVGAEHAIAVQLQLAPMGLGERGERVRVRVLRVGSADRGHA